VNRYRGHANSGFRHLGAVLFDRRLDEPIDIRQDEDERCGDHDSQRTSNGENFSATLQDYASSVSALLMIGKFPLIFKVYLALEKLEKIRDPSILLIRT